jgi:hypothetical protein
METLKNESVSDLYAKLLESEPKAITNFVPENAAEQRDAFLKGDIENPDHNYSKLKDYDFDATLEKIDSIGERILQNPDLNPKHVEAYEAFIEGYKNKTRLMALATQFKAAEPGEEKDSIAKEFMELNIELHGEPDEETYRSLLFEKVSKINKKKFVGEAAKVADELNKLIELPEGAEEMTRFTPSDETVSWMHETVQGLYGGMLDKIPEGDSFTSSEVQAIFQDILESEFGEAAEGWKVDIESAKSINVKTTEKRIVLPEDTKDMSAGKLRSLVVHELGVHMLRSIIGGDTDLEPLKSGLNDYYDAEEGLGVVMEQALLGEYKERGVPLYLTAGLAFFDNKDFRETFEAKWRMGALEKLKDGEDLTTEAIDSAKRVAYSSVMRIMRGTDELPWFKDLAYYNGSASMWQHLENIQGDEIKFSFVLMGKANPADINHERLMYETKTN